MSKIPSNKIPQKVFDLYDDYAHNQIERREFIDRLSAFAVGGMTVASLMDRVMPNYIEKVQITSDDPRIDSEYIYYDSPKGGGKMKALLCKPKDQSGKLPGVVVVHENRGLNPHIEDVCMRAALAGFVAIAPDALTPLGGYPGTDDEGRTMQRKREKPKMLEDFIAAFEYLKPHANCTGKVGVVGFCFGGWISNMMAVRVPDLGAAVPFYGGQPDDEDVVNINAPLMLHFADKDKRVNAGWPDYEAALKANNKEYIAHMYTDANHGFHNDTTERFDPADAKLAWDRTVEFFKEKLN